MGTGSPHIRDVGWRGEFLVNEALWINTAIVCRGMDTDVYLNHQINPHHQSH